MVVTPPPHSTLQVRKRDASCGTVVAIMSVRSRWSWWALMPHRTRVLAPMASASISATQISPESRGSSCSVPTSQMAVMQSGSVLARSVTSTRPAVGA